MVVLKVEVDSRSLCERVLLESAIEYESAEWAATFAQDILANGNQGVKVIRKDGFAEVVIMALACVRSAEKHWEHPLLHTKKC